MLLKHSKEMTFTTIYIHLINSCLEFVGLYMKRKWERTLKNLITRLTWLEEMINKDEGSHRTDRDDSDLLMTGRNQQSDLGTRKQELRRMKIWK